MQRPKSVKSIPLQLIKKTIGINW